MGYAVYEDDVIGYARVHLESCRTFANRTTTILPNNRWHDSDYTSESAVAKAKSVEPQDVRSCHICGTVG